MMEVCRSSAERQASTTDHTASESSSSCPTSPADLGYDEDLDKKGGASKLLLGKRKRGKEEMLCQVCGDKAQGINFDAITCESCKAFFRRNALKDKKGKCMFDGSCVISVTTRKFCSYCRLRKCFEVGMNKELILGDEERKKRMEKVMHNREKKMKLEQQLHALAQTQAIQMAAQVAPALQNIATPAVTPPTSVADSQEIPPIIVAPDVSPPTPLTPSLASPLPVNGDSPSTPGVPDLVSPVLLGDNSDKRTLSSWEDATLKDIKEMFNISFCVDVEPHIHVKVKDPTLNHLINQSGITVLRIIKFAKQLKEFVRLPQEHQIGILKGAVLDILLLRSVALYDRERDAWVTPKGEIPTEILKSATGFVELYNAYVNYCKNLRLIIGDDNVIIAIMLVIALFSPEGPHVQAKQLISGFQDQYMTLLKHYIEAQYSYRQAAEMFPKLLCKVKEIKDFADTYGKVVMDVNPSEIEPLMLEILDLK